LVVFCGFCGLGIAYVFAPISSGPERSVRLSSDGDRLYITNLASKKEQDLIPGKGNNVSVDFTILPEHDSPNIVTIKDGPKTVVSETDTRWCDAFWSARHQAAYYLLGNGGDSTNGHPGSIEIWKWTRADGAKLWHTVIDKKEASIFPVNMTESFDGKWFCFGGVGERAHYKRHIYLVSAVDKKESWFATDIDNGEDTPIFMIDENTFVLPGLHDSTTHTSIFDRRSGKSRPCTIDGELEQFVEFLGEPWALRFLNGKYDVVKVSRNVDRIVQTMTIPSH
jgi:hypothetical protein